MRLIVAPHYDDADIGASTLADGAVLVVVAGGDGERLAEQKQSAPILGIKEVVRGDWPDGAVVHDKALVRFVEGVTEGMSAVLSPPVLDTHQDHAAVARAVISALRRSPLTLIEYDTPSVMPEWTPTLWVPLSQSDLDRQVWALDCFNSQNGRAYMSLRWVEARAHFRGQQVGLDHAQAFRVVRAVSSRLPEEMS